MTEGKEKLSGADFARGISLTSVKEGSMRLGHARGEPVILVRRGDVVHAVGAVCTHYGAPLADGLLVEDTVRCPWHHACFSLRNGEVLRAPALTPIACWKVEQRDGVVYVREKLEHPHPDAPVTPSTPRPATPRSIVIGGGGGAGNAAAEMLRQLGYSGSITMLSADASPPYDRPNLSKGGLAGTGAAEVTPPRSAQFYRDQRIDLRLNVRVARIDVAARQVELEDGSRQGWDALLLATGADPVRVDFPGSDLPHVHYLRTAADCDALVAAAQKAKGAVVIGASFIGLEVAASLRARKLDVHVVGREAVPMEKVLGPEVGRFIRSLHEQHGVGFHLGCTPASIDASAVTLSNGERLIADLVVIGVGVRPNVALAQQAGLAIHGGGGGVSVDEHLETSVPGIYAAGDIAAWPDPLSSERIRVEHWVVAERQGQTAARNMLGAAERFTAVPFFWTEQYDFGLAYIGHAERFDTVDIDGNLDAHDCKITYLRGDRKLAVAVVHRDLEGLRAEVEFERTIEANEWTGVPGRGPAPEMSHAKERAS
ncbi:MAG: FAD-dependent oxidoreductase [Pseudomonadota bacterium]|nr:FAD-dependent oxidoreductase [Pseudomonadota bacterium]